MNGSVNGAGAPSSSNNTNPNSVSTNVNMNVNNMQRLQPNSTQAYMMKLLAKIQPLPGMTRQQRLQQLLQSGELKKEDIMLLQRHQQMLKQAQAAKLKQQQQKAQVMGKTIPGKSLPNANNRPISGNSLNDVNNANKTLPGTNISAVSSSFGLDATASPIISQNTNNISIQPPLPVDVSSIDRCKVFLDFFDILSDSLAERKMTKITKILIIAIGLSVAVSMFEILVRYLIISRL